MFAYFRNNFVKEIEVLMVFLSLSQPGMTTVFWAVLLKKHLVLSTVTSLMGLLLL